MDALVSPEGSTDSMTSPIDEGGGSPRCHMPLVIQPKAMINAHWQLQHIWSRMHDSDKVRRCQTQFDVDNSDECKLNIKILIAFATASLQEDLLWKSQVASFEKYSHDEQEVKRQSLSMAPRV